jgi:hypothetical protein
VCSSTRHQVVPEALLGAVGGAAQAGDVLKAVRLAPAETHVSELDASQMVVLSQQ